MKEEEIVFETEDTALGSSGMLVSLSSVDDTTQYQTRSGRAVKPVIDYIPTLGAAKKYEELVLYQVGKLKEGQTTMKIKGEAADYLILADPRLYRKFVRLENGATVLYVELKMALYGQLRAAPLFYKKFVSDLQGIGLY